MKILDSKETIMINHYKEILQNRKFDEYDFLGFLIVIRRHIEKEEKYKSICDAAHLIAHRERDRGIAFDAMSNAITNNYETISGSNRIKDYEGIDFNIWKKEWKLLFEELGMILTNEIILDITLCFFSLAQFTTHSNCELILVAGDNQELGLATTENTPDSLWIIFCHAGPYNIIEERIDLKFKNPVWTERDGTVLRLRDKDGYII